MTPPRAALRPRDRSARSRRRLAGAVFALHLLLPFAAGAGDGGEPPARGRPGEFCPLGGCRSAAPTPGSGTAFGLAVLAIAWTARRRDAER